MIKLPEMAFSA